MKRYELTFLIAPETSEEEREGYFQKISEFITKEDGTIEEIKKPIRKRMGVAVSERKEAFLATLFFTLNPEKTGKLKQFLEGEKNIIRHIIVKKKENAIFKKSSPKAELKEIDKKIDEILKIGE
ncbi:MAG: 30S ribosomal protein S6 [Candidatus Pacebacteria bacterium]|nr:30S ribosomal protein S6 [Candidatus Paceibacterota bacterium]